MSPSRLFTLLLEDRRARLLDGAGTVLAVGGEPILADWAAVLAKALPAKARVQLILAGPRSAIQCLDVPSLPARERKEVARRVAREAGTEDQLSAHTLDPDAQAEGGHVLWVASHPRQELEPWLELLRGAGARPVFALPWQRALFDAGGQDQPSALYLTLEAGSGRALFFRGRSLRFTRNFLLPPRLDPMRLGPDEAGELCRLVTEEVSLILQFIQQKHWGAPPRVLFTVGLAPAPESPLEPVGRALGLAITNLASDLPAFLVAGARQERRKGALDLLPEEIRDARKRAWFRSVVWSSVLGVALLGCGLRVFLGRHQAALTREALQAEASMAQRKALAEEGDEAARLRFGLLRVRRAEERQKHAMEQIERLGVRLFQLPQGVRLQKVTITQEPGDTLVHRFTVEGSAMDPRGFSLGLLASYYAQVSAFPGLAMEPLREVVVADAPAGGSPGPAPEQGFTRFHLGGTAP